MSLLISCGSSDKNDKKPINDNPNAVLVKDEVEQAISVHVERAKEEHRLKTQVLTIHV